MSNDTTPPPAADTPAQDAGTWRKKVYIGPVTADKGKTLYAFLPIDENGDALPEREGALYSKPFGCMVGGVYEINHATDTAVRYTGQFLPRFVERYHDSARVMQWQTQARTHDALKLANGKMKAEMSENLLKESLAPIRALMRKTSPQGRRAIVALVLEYLQVD